MKKQILIVFLLTMLLLSGCSSDAKYTELEERVARLENMLGITNSSEPPTSEESNGAEDSEDNSTSDTSVALSYVLDSMSAEEILAECECFFNNLPYEGETYEEFEGTLKVPPISKSISSGMMEYVFCSDDTLADGESVFENDFVQSIRYGQFPMQMDGTIGYPNASYPLIDVGIVLHISDYEKASSVYSLLFDSLQNSYTNINDNRETTRWEAQGLLLLSDGKTAGLYVPFLLMDKKTSGYVITISRWIELGE